MSGVRFYVVVHSSESVSGYTYRAIVPQAIIYSERHAAKAIEVSIRARESGLALLNFDLEVARRLLSRKQVRDVVALLESLPESSKCIIDAFREVERARSIKPQKTCSFNREFVRRLMFEGRFQVTEGQSFEEKLIVAIVEQTLLNRWLA
uniref:Uncharacterized protein n=1 Tax=Fervidicoccus fontis TaxID=683846 RepID=A0A7J3ZIP1_9CREN